MTFGQPKSGLDRIRNMSWLFKFDTSKFRRSQMLKMMRRFSLDKAGVTAIEYGLIAGLVSVVIITILTTMGQSMTQIFTTISNALTTAAGGGGAGG